MNKKTDTADLIYSFFNEVGIIEQLARTRVERVLPDGMKMPHFGVLNHLVRLGKEESPAELANAFQVTRPTMTNTLQRLQAKNYIMVEADPRDGRAKLVLITQKGRDARQAAIAALAPLLEQIADGLGNGVFAKALEPLQRVRVYMDENRA